MTKASRDTQGGRKEREKERKKERGRERERMEKRKRQVFGRCGHVRRAKMAGCLDRCGHVEA